MEDNPKEQPEKEHINTDKFTHTYIREKQEKNLINVHMWLQIQGHEEDTSVWTLQICPCCASINVT